MCCFHINLFIFLISFLVYLLERCSRFILLSADGSKHQGSICFHAKGYKHQIVSSNSSARTTNSIVAERNSSRKVSDDNSRGKFIGKDQLKAEKSFFLVKSNYEDDESNQRKNGILAAFKLTTILTSLE